MSRWYVAMTKDSKTAERELRKQGFIVFNPRVRVRTGGRLRILPYIQGYLFLFFDVELDPWQRVNNTRGCKRLFVCDERPVPVRRGVIEALLSSCEDGEGYVIDEAKAQDIILRFKKDQAIRIVKGPLQGREGRVEGDHSVSSPHEIISIILEVFGRPSSLRIKASEVQAA